MDRESLLIILRKIKRLLIKSPKITSFVLLIIVFSVVSVFVQDNNLKDKSIIVESKIDPSPTLIPTPTIIIVTSAPKIVERKKEVSQSAASNLDTTISSPDPSPTTAVTNVSQDNEGLLNAVNRFRSANGISSLSSSGTLCQIAEKRLTELIGQGSLDSHAGFDKYFKGQTEFKGMGENLHWATYSETGAEIVENGWAKSPGHLANILDSKWQYGCGGQAGSHFASFIFASK